jgi:hypothetical protein
MKKTRQLVRAIKQSIYLDVYGFSSLLLYMSMEQSIYYFTMVQGSISSGLLQGQDPPGVNIIKHFFTVTDNAAK